MKKYLLTLVAIVILSLVVLGSSNLDSVDCGVCNGKAISLPAPEVDDDLSPYGSVRVEISIDSQGKVTKAKAVSGQNVLYPATEQAALKARFRPFEKDGKRVPAHGSLIYSFGN